MSCVRDRRKEQGKKWCGEFLDVSVRDIFSRFDGFLQGITSQPASHLLFRVLFRSSFILFFFFLSVSFFFFALKGGGVEGVSSSFWLYYTDTLCTFIYLLVCMLCYHCSVCSSCSFFDLIRFCFGSMQKGGTSRHVRKHRERPSRQADLAEAEVLAHIHIYGIQHL